MNNKLSIVLATKNEEYNIGNCLESVKPIADEIIVYDEFSTDKTREIAKSYGAKIYKYQHKKNFHETKQKAIEKATGDWILQLDADERVTEMLADEIREVINKKDRELLNLKIKDKRKEKLFKRHQRLIETREGKLGKRTDEAVPAGRQVVAFFIPRVNMFLGKPLIHAGVYPDGVIRLVKKGKARLPAKSVHELMEIDGEVRWLNNHLEHFDSPTLKRYFQRMKRYTDIKAVDFRSQDLSRNIITFLYYITVKPLVVFSILFIMHKGFLDGYRGFLWSLFSALHFPVAFYKYLRLSK